MKTLRILQHGTNAYLATIRKDELNAWCDAYGYLPHHGSMKLGYYVVIGK